MRSTDVVTLNNSVRYTTPIWRDIKLLKDEKKDLITWLYSLGFIKYAECC